jgi:hypothetical protein
MESFWEAALASCGLAAVGAFLFWSLSKKWLSLRIFAKISPEKTFIIMKLFLWLLFILIIMMLVIYLVGNWMNHKNDIDSLVNTLQERATSTVNDMSEAIETLNYRIGMGQREKLQNLKNRFLEIHQKNIEAIKNGDLHLSHVLIGEIHEVQSKFHEIVSSESENIKSRIIMQRKFYYDPTGKQRFADEMAKRSQIMKFDNLVKRTELMQYPGKPLPNLPQDMLDLIFTPGEPNKLKDNN